MLKWGGVTSPSRHPLGISSGRVDPIMPNKKKKSKEEIAEDELVTLACREVDATVDADVVKQLVLALEELRKINDLSDDESASSDAPNFNLNIGGTEEARRLVQNIKKNIAALAMATPKDLAKAMSIVKAVGNPITCRFLAMMAEHNLEVEKSMREYPAQSEVIKGYDWIVKRIHEQIVTKGGLHIDNYLMEVINLLKTAFCKWGDCLFASFQSAMKNEYMVRLVEHAVKTIAAQCLNNEMKQMKATLASVQENNAVVLDRLHDLEKDLGTRVKDVCSRVAKIEVELAQVRFDLSRRARSPIPESNLPSGSPHRGRSQGELHRRARERARSESPSDTPGPIPLFRPSDDRDLISLGLIPVGIAPPENVHHPHPTRCDLRR